MKILTHRIRLYPNNCQATYLTQAAGTARFAYNWGLARWQEMYEAGEKPSWQKLNTELNAIKRERFPWMLDVTKWAPQGALNDLGSAFRNFFRRIKRGEKPGYPKFKKKDRCRESFYVAGANLRFDNLKVHVPRLGWVRIAEPVRFPGRVISTRFAHRAGKWFVSINVEVAESWVYPHRCENQAVVGVDLGVVRLAVPSRGEPTIAPRALRFYEKRLKRLQRELARRQMGGSNWKKTRLKIQKTHERIANIRKDVTHKLTTDLVKNFRWIGIEDLNVMGMLRNRWIAKSVMDAALSEARRQLEYKAPLAGSTVVIADRWFPSTKRCSSCGAIKNMPLGEETYICPACGVVEDRDDNASKNLEQLAAGYAVEYARGAGSAGDAHIGVVKLPSVKRELSSRRTKGVAA